MRMQLTLVGVAGCFFDWILTRPWKKLALYFLPILLAIFVIGVTSGGSWLNRDHLTDRYVQLANAEVDEWEKQWVSKPEADESESSPPQAGQPAAKEIPASAEMLFRRVQQLQQNDSRSMFFVALCYIQRGASTQGLAMLNRLAPGERTGYPPAHAFLVEHMLKKPIPAAELPLLRHHAEGAMLWPEISPQLLATLSDLFARFNLPEKAVDAMTKAVARDKKYLLLLAQMTQGNPRFGKLSEESLEKAETYFTEKLAKKPLDIATRLMLADAQRLQSRLEAAEKTIVEGRNLADSQPLRSAQSELYCQIFVKTSEFKDGVWSGDVDLLEKAYGLDPNNPHIIDEVARLARPNGKSLDSALVKQLRENLATGQATSVTHMWLAEHFLNANDLANAIPHLEQAVKRDPMAARCWNNLAYCLADVDPTRLDEALKGVDQAIAIMPLMPDYHDTRGTILMKLKRPGDAIAAYERAIELIAKTNGAIPPQPAYHERLAQAYAEAGDKDMAETHRAFAAKLVAQRQAQAEAEAKRSAQPSPSQPAPPPTTPPASAPAPQAAPEPAARESKSNSEATSPKP